MSLVEKHEFAPGNTNIYDSDHPQYSLEDMRLEMSSYGKGDIREPFIETVHDDGAMTDDFIFESAVIEDGRQKLSVMPCAYDDEKTINELTIILADKNYGLKLELHYCVFEGRDVITRYSKLINESESDVRLKRLMSMQLDFEDSGYVFTTFNGGWAREMNRHDTLIYAGKHVNSSYTGSSSSRANPFVMYSFNTNVAHWRHFVALMELTR